MQKNPFIESFLGCFFNFGLTFSTALKKLLINSEELKILLCGMVELLVVERRRVLDGDLHI